jgi:catechol 2,3-dioxygenase-like lactoylglutathione lyase family enzyme
MPDSILGPNNVIAFVPITDCVKARAFYQDVLGLRLASDEQPFALVFDASGTMLRATIVHELKPQQFTILGWSVADIEGTVDRLSAAGVAFQRYQGVNDGDPRAVWNSPGGARVAWFKDPDGNVLSVTQFPK